jgi:hypothetical protein
MVAIVPIPNPLWGGNDPTVRAQSLGRPFLCIYTQSDFSAGVCSAAGPGSEKKEFPGGHELEGMQDQVVDEAKRFLQQHL